MRPLAEICCARSNVFTSTNIGVMTD